MQDTYKKKGALCADTTKPPFWGVCSSDYFIRRVRKIAKSNLPSCPSTCSPAWKNSAPTGRIFIKFDIWVFSEICRLNSSFIKIWQESLHEDRYTFVIISRSVLRMINVSEKCCGENQNTHFMFCNFFPSRKSCRLWSNAEKYCRAGQVTRNQRPMCIACWIPKATYTHSEYVIHVIVPLEK